MSEPRHCIKCGREIGPDESMCEVCNRAGMATPSASQYHGTIAVAIVAGIAALAIAASLATRDVGPFQAERLSFEPTSEQVEVVARVTNLGTRTGTASCRLTARDAAGRAMRTQTVTLQVPAGGEATLTQTISGLRATPRDVSVECS